MGSPGWVREPIGFSASPSVSSEKRLTLNVIKTRLHAAACSIALEDVPADRIHHPFAFDALSSSKSGLAPLAVDVFEALNSEPRPNPGVYRGIQLSAANQGAGFGAWCKKVYTPNANQERFF